MTGRFGTERLSKTINGRLTGRFGTERLSVLWMLGGG